MTKKRGGITAGELLRDPAFQAQQAAALERIAHNLETYKRHAAPLLQELRNAGFAVETVGELREGPPYPAAVPILIEWLPKIEERHVKQDIFRALSVPWARPDAAPPLLREFKKLPDKPLGVKWAAGNALEVVADDSVFEEIAEIATDPGYGKARQMVVAALGNMANPRAEGILIDLLDDEAVAPFAVMGLGKLKATAAREKIEPFLDHPEETVRAEAKRALAKIDRAAKSNR